MLHKRQAKVLFDLWFWILWFEGVPEEGVAAEILEFVEEREAKNSLVTSKQAVHSKGTLQLL